MRKREMREEIASIKEDMRRLMKDIFQFSCAMNDCNYQLLNASVTIEGLRKKYLHGEDKETQKR